MPGFKFDASNPYKECMDIKRAPPPKLSQLHVFSDKSILRRSTARDLIKIPIWNGNRILNEEHKKEIATSLETIRSLDLKPFHLVTYPCEDENGAEEIKTFIVDGQHRVSILKEAFYNNPETDNFDLLVVEKSCDSQADVSAYFKLLNMTRSIEWKEDPKMLANPYVNLFEATFNKGKKEKEKLVRAGATKRPYLSLEALREMIVKHIDEIKKETPQQFVERIVEVNKAWIEHYKIKVPQDKSIERAVAIGFTLPQDPKWSWLCA
jgi:hypothetical protein